MAHGAAGANLRVLPRWEQLLLGETPSMSTQLLLLAAAAVALLPSSVAAAACTSTSDCNLNGECTAGKCVCDAAWSGSADCAVMSFAKVEKAAGKAPGYYNATESSWGGFPIKGSDGKWNLIHAQMANHCPLGSWTSNSIVARSVSTTASPLGPYAFVEELLPPFAHNPTVRKAPDGTYFIFFIGGWHNQTVKTCNEDDSPVDNASAPPDNCTGGVTFDSPTSIRVGGDYRATNLHTGATAADCAASCCADQHCDAFSFNNGSSSAPPVCKHKNGGNKLQTHTCPCCAAHSTTPGCSSGALGRAPAPPAPPAPLAVGETAILLHPLFIPIAIPD